MISRFPKSKLDHNVRLLEAETANELGIIFTEDWYDIPVISREYMIATRLAKAWIEMIATEDVIK